MAQMVKAVRMILEMESVGSSPKQLVKNPFDIEIEDDAPKRKPSLEEIDALEVYFLFYVCVYLHRLRNLTFVLSVVTPILHGQIFQGRDNIQLHIEHFCFLSVNYFHSCLPTSHA